MATPSVAILNHGATDLGIPTRVTLTAGWYKFCGWRVMAVRLFNNMQHWQERAEQARMQAEQLTDPEAKRMMLGIAESYERLAKRAEGRRLSAEQPETQRSGQIGARQR